MTENMKAEAAKPDVCDAKAFPNPGEIHPTLRFPDGLNGSANMKDTHLNDPYNLRHD